MKFHTMIALIVAALTLTAGAAAAMPGNAPTDAATAGNGAADADESAAQDAETNETDANETDGNEPADASDTRGPPADLPAQVPDHVSQIHDLIGQFLAGDLTGSLGESVSSVAGNDSESPDSSQSPTNASADAAA